MCLVVAIQWNGSTKLVSMMEWFHSSTTMVLGWGEGGLKKWLFWRFYGGRKWLQVML